MFELRIRGYLWIIVGAACLLVLVVGVVRFNQFGESVARQTFQTERLDLLNRTRLALASASEAEKSAVLGATDEDSRGYADQAGGATTQADRLRLELQRLLEHGGSARERALLVQFSEVFAKFQRVDTELLALAVKNTNIKAAALAFGPASEAIGDMNAALSAVVSKSTVWPESRSVVLLALGAENAVLRNQALLAPHIAEESDVRMDEFEARMKDQAREVQRDLDVLAALPKLSEDPDLAKAIGAYRTFSDVKTKILTLSRENTNVRSLSMSLTQKRRVMLVCQETLAALEQAITDEPGSGLPRARPASPR